MIDYCSLQLPLLMKRTMLAEEICKIRGANVVFSTININSFLFISLYFR